jgi:hypothetical protein
MKRSEREPAWIRDLHNRQRNIVFPDTVLNEGRFYRNLVSGKTPLNTVQRIGMIVLGAFFVTSGSWATAFSLAGMMQNFTENWMAAITILVSGFFIFLGAKLIIQGVFRSPEPEPAPKRKINYRPRARRKA